MPIYKKIAVFEKYIKTDVASLIKKAEWNPAEIGASFLPHVKRFHTGKIYLNLIHKGLAEKIGGSDYMEKLKSNPAYIWEKLQENLDIIGVVNDKRIAKKKLPISMIVDAEIAAVCNEAKLGPRIRKVPLSANALGEYRTDPSDSSHFQEHAMEKRLESEI